MDTPEAAPAPTTLPDDLFGPGPDRFLRRLAAFSNVYLRVTSSRRGVGLGRPPVVGTPSWRDLVVAERSRVAQDAVSFRFAAPGGGPLPAWHPGAHLRIELPSGLIRHYSLCGDPADRRGYTVAVRRLGDGGGGSVFLHDEVKQGSQIRVMVPRNAFPFAAEPAVLFLAGGIGITPILPMVREAARRGLDWRLVYTGRSRATMPFATELEELGGARVQILADDETGHVPDCAELLRAAPRGAAVYCCGPAPMLEGVRRAVDAAEPGRLSGFHFERFTAAPILDGHEFELELARSGKVLRVPADRSALDVLCENDPATPYSCRQGFCGVCRLTVSAGQVEHRDRRLTERDHAEGAMLVCVSRAPEGERLVIDR
jgi:ferredoxin-NADP reductase